MKTYILKLKTTSTTNYNLYDGTTLVSDSDLATLFGSAGSAYFTFDFNSLTPTNTTSLTILNSQDTAVITNTGLSGIAEDKNFKGTWGASATTFTSFELLKGMTMDEAQLGTLAGMIKNGGIKTLTTADYNWSSTGNPPFTAIDFATMESGIYKTAQNVTIRRRNYTKIVPTGSTIIVINESSNTKVAYVFSTSAIDAQAYAWYSDSYHYNLIPRQEFTVINNLTSTSTTNPLSANQGKVLNDNIGNLTTLTTTAKTSAVAAINELDAEIGDIATALNIINNGGGN